MINLGITGHCAPFVVPIDKYNQAVFAVRRVAMSNAKNSGPRAGWPPQMCIKTSSFSCNMTILFIQSMMLDSRQSPLLGGTKRCRRCGYACRISITQKAPTTGT